MLKFRLLLLSLCVFASALYASEKENAVQNQSSFIDRFIFPNPSTKHNRSQPTKEDVPTKELVAKRRVSMPVLSQALPNTPKPQDVLSESDLFSKKEAQELRLDLLEGQSDLQRQVSGIEKNLTQRIEEVIGSLGNSVVEVKEVPHNLQPEVDGLRSQLKELLEKAATYEEQLQSAATKEQVEQLGKDFAAVIGDLNKVVEELPTSEDVKSSMKALAKGLKQYSEKHFATKNEMNAKLVHKAERSDLNDAQECIKEIAKKIPTQSNPQGFAREAGVNRSVHDLKQKQDDLAAQLADKAGKSDLHGFATNEDLEALQTNHHKLQESIKTVEATVSGLPTSESVRSQITEATEPMNEKIGLCEKQAQSLEQQLQEAKALIPTAKNPQGLIAKADIEKTVQVLNGQLEVKANRSDLHGYATKEDIEGFVAQKTHEETVQKLQERIIALEQNSPKEQLKSGIIYIAKQSALGCVSYRLAPHMASLLRSLKLENSYVDLETVAVPTTTFAVSFLARLAKEAHEKGQNASVQDVGKEAALDAGVSAGMMGLRYIFFDDQMNEHVEQMSETERTAGYAGCYAILRSVVALFV